MSTHPAPVFGRAVDGVFVEVHDAAAFFARFFASIGRRPLHVGEIVKQCYEVGVKTLPLITLTGFITGIVFTTQSRPSLEAFGAASWLP